MAEKASRISDEAVKKATGRTWSEWEAWLDDHDGHALSHKGLVRLLHERGNVDSGWWRQTVTNGYEKLKGRRVTGETEGAGFQIGVQRTVAIPHERAWRLLTSPDGVRAWLGDLAGAGDALELELEEGETYRLADGAEGEVRVVRPNKHLRITWQPEGWSRASTIQARVEPKGEKTVISFHEEHLPSPEEREARRRHFKAALAALVALAGA